MAEITNLVVSAVANSLSKILIDEYAVLGDGTVRHVEWIERELRSMHGLLEQVEQHGYGQQEQALNEWAEQLKDVARDAEDVIETFVIKSVKRRRWGVLYWFDKHKIGKELLHIRKRIRDTSKARMDLNRKVVVSVETPAQEASSSYSTTSSLTNTAMEKLNHILSQNLITNDEVIEMVEEIKDDLGHLQNIASNLKTTVQRENLWLEEVNDIFNYTADAAENFIARREKWFKILKFKKQMKHVVTQIGDALHRCFTYEVDMGVGDNEITRSTTVPIQDLLVESFIISQIPFLVFYNVLFLSPLFGVPTFFFFLIIFHLFEFTGEKGRRTEHKPKLIHTQKKKGSGKTKKEILRLLEFYRPFMRPSMLIYLLTFWLFQFLPTIQIPIVLNLSYPFYQVIAWHVNLQRSMDDNLKCTQRYLALIHVFLSDAEGFILNERQRVWMVQLRVLYRKGQSLIDAEGTGGCLSRTKYAKDINSLLKEILDISYRKVIYGIANIIPQGPPDLNVPLLGSISIQESEIDSDHDDNSGTATPTPARAPASSSSYQPVTGLQEKVQSIRGEKELIDAMLVDAQEMGELDGRSRIWVEQLRGISLEAQSVLNKYDAKLKHKSILIYIFKSRSRHVINKKIDGIRNKIEDASRRRKAYGLVQIQSRVVLSSSMVQILRARTQPSLVAKESSVIGFDDDAQVLMAELLSDQKRRFITCIVGIRGTGKTTLAKLIFEDNVIVSHFQRRLWVSLPSNCTTDQFVAEICKEAAKQITAVEEEILSTDHVLANLARTKYLVVVDGIKETSQVYLDTLNRAIPDMSTGSRVLFTTRNANVAQHAAGTIFVHPLQLLDDETSWVLFTRHLKVDVDIPPESELMKFRREIVMKCGGLPSQILKMSDLHSNQDVKLTHGAWTCVTGGNQLNEDQIYSWSETLDTINLSLPSYLRRCLFYFVFFPAEFGIPVRRLVVLWVAEGLVHHSEEMPPELVAERYLTELIDRNMVQVSKRKRNGKVKTCRLPSALRQLWLTKANEFKSLQHPTVTDTDSNVQKKNSIIRRVADHLDNKDIWNYHIHSDSTDSTTLRTNYKDVLSFLSFDTREGSKPGQQVGNFLKGCISSDCFLLLRVLDLERVYKPKLPNHIARLSRLRYLGLRWTYSESLPSSISKLLKLQTLDLKHTYIHTLPTSIWKMELRHLFLSETYRTKFPPQPKGNSLSDLQTFWGLFVDEETPVKDGLDRLVNITKLGLACQSMSLNEDAMIAQLEAVADWIKKLELLRSVRLKSRDEKGQPWILHLKSFENNVNLTDMYLLGSLSSSSVCISQFPRSLVDLTLSHSKLEVDPMILLKDFPNLQTLCLLAESYTGTTMICKSQSFPQLQVLKIWVLERLQEWNIEHGALPCLRQLEIRSCRNLQRLPDGLKHVNTLLELKLTNMPKEINAEPDNIPPNCNVDRKYFQ